MGFAGRFGKLSCNNGAMSNDIKNASWSRIRGATYASPIRFTRTQAHSQRSQLAGDPAASISANVYYSVDDAAHKHGQLIEYEWQKQH
jgi:hypothetical protein